MRLYALEEILELDPNTMRLDSKNEQVLQVVRDLAEEVIELRNRVEALEKES